MSAIQGVPPVAFSKPVAPKAQSTAAETPQQEASESVAETRSEAAKGDQQAIRKLAAAQPPPSTQPVVKPKATGSIDLQA